MLSQIIFYFFFVFGVLQFVLLIWELIFPADIKSAVVLYPVDSTAPNIEGGLKSLSRQGLSVYAVPSGAECEKTVEKIAKFCPNLQIIEQDDTHKTIRDFLYE